jgi:hypothetical protein
VAIFELVVSLLNLSDAHGIVAENRLNLPDGFHLALTKLLAKFDAIPLPEAFCHFHRKQRCNACCVHTLTPTLAARD